MSSRYAMAMSERFTVQGTTWEWRATGKAATWYFMTVEGQAAAEIRYAAMGGTGGFGSVRVTVTIGETRWQTSLFPHRETGGWLLPLKAAVRKAEGIVADQRLKAVIEF